MKLLSFIGLLCGFCLSASGQGVVTLTVPPSSAGPGTAASNEVAIASDQSANLLTLSRVNASGEVLVQIIKDSQTISWPSEAFAPRNESLYIAERVIAGPATIRLLNYPDNAPAFLTLDIQPSQYPPGKSAVIGERDGPMKCTLEESTDLVNWTQSTSGQTHSLTNVNAKKFFRIKLEQDITP